MTTYLIENGAVWDPFLDLPLPKDPTLDSATLGQLGQSWLDSDNPYRESLREQRWKQSEKMAWLELGDHARFVENNLLHASSDEYCRPDYGRHHTYKELLRQHRDNQVEPVVYMAISEVIPQLERIEAGQSSGAISPEGLTTQDFEFIADPVGMLTFLQISRFPAMQKIRQMILSGHKPEDCLRQLANLSKGCDMVRETSDDYELYRWSDYVTTTLYLDKHSGTCNITFSANPNRYYLEQDEDTGQVSSPFVETVCCRELIEIFGSYGMELNPSIADEITNGLAEPGCFGGTYTVISRIIAEWVNEPDNTWRATDLIIPRGRGITSRHARFPQMPSDSYEPEVRAVLEKLDFGGYSDPTSILLGIVQQVALRGDRRDTQLPVLTIPVDLNKGSCYKSAKRWMVGAFLPTEKKLAAPYEEHGVKMLRKTAGDETYLLTVATEFNGVILPPGALLKRETNLDGTPGYVFMRLTPFISDSNTTRQAFCSEPLAAAHLSGADIGKVSLSGLIHRASQNRFRP